MGRSPRISVAVPSLNYARFLHHCLESIRTQSFRELEVLIADGGSTDDSLEIIRRYTANDARFRLISRCDTGQPDAVRQAFEVSSGDIFCFLNADDCYLTNDALALVISTFDANPRASVASFGGWYIDERGQRIRPVRLRYHPLDTIRLMRYRTAVLQPATFWRREVQATIPLQTDFHYSFDSVFFYEAYQRFAWIEHPERLAGYRLHGGNKSMGVRVDRVEELARFEALKFGERSARAAYVRGVAAVLRGAGQIGAVAPILQRGVSTLVKAVSYASVYRVPGI